MKAYQNIECRRCGYKWYSEKYEENEAIPDECPRCYRSEVQEIPDPPTRIDLFLKNLRKKKKRIPVIFDEKRHDFIIWKEQNRFLISMLETGLVMFLLVAGLVYALFFL